MALLVILAETAVLSIFGVPRADAIAGAFRAAQPETSSFGWAGPAPRITRTAEVAMRTFKTSAAWIGQWPKETTNLRPPMAALVAALRESVARELGAATGDTWTVKASTFNEAVNGPLAWWRSGEASRTRTSNSQPNILTQAWANAVGGSENPIGPNVISGSAEGAADQMRQASDAAKRALQQATEALKISAVIVVPFVAWLIAREVRRTVRQNPGHSPRRGLRR